MSQNLYAEAGAADRGDYLVHATGRRTGLREIRLGDVEPLTLANARDAARRKRLEHEDGRGPQHEKRKGCGRSANGVGMAFVTLLCVCAA